MLRRRGNYSMLPAAAHCYARIDFREAPAVTAGSRACHRLSTALNSQFACIYIGRNSAPRYSPSAVRRFNRRRAAAGAASRR